MWKLLWKSKILVLVAGKKKEGKKKEAQTLNRELVFWGNTDFIERYY